MRDPRFARANEQPATALPAEQVALAVALARELVAGPCAYARLTETRTRLSENAAQAWDTFHEVVSTEARLDPSNRDRWAEVLEVDLLAGIRDPGCPPRGTQPRGRGCCSSSPAVAALHVLNGPRRAAAHRSSAACSRRCPARCWSQQST